MSLSSSQLATLKAAILAETDPIFVAYRNDGASSLMAAWLNNPAAPTETAWSMSADRRTLDEAATYTTFDTLAAGKRDLWRIFLDGAPRDMAKAKNRNVVVDVWGAATNGSIAAAILAAGTRSISKAEKILIGSSAIETKDTVSALDLVWEGPLQASDVVDALALA